MFFHFFLTYETSTLSTEQKVDKSIYKYMHISDYTESLGYCNDIEHAYYSKAKEYFNNKLSEETKELFITDNTYVSSYNRLLEWVRFNNDELDTSTYTLVNKSSLNLYSFETSSNSTLIVILTISIISIFGVSLLIVKKKNLNN